MNINIIYALICLACVVWNLCLPYQDWVTRSAAAISAVGAIFCFWVAFR